jgi:hypothetical protein
MRYADYDGPAGEVSASTGPGVVRHRTIDRLRWAVREQQFWVLERRGHGRSWTLARFDDRTGVIGPAQFASGPIGDDASAAMDWARTLVDVDNWVHLVDDRSAYIDELQRLISDIAWRPRLPGRSLVLRIENDPHTPKLVLVVIRQRWAATGRLSAPLSIMELPMFQGDVAAALDWASRRYGVDRSGWRQVGAGEYHHDG